MFILNSFITIFFKHFSFLFLLLSRNRKYFEIDSNKKWLGYSFKLQKIMHLFRTWTFSFFRNTNIITWHIIWHTLCIVHGTSYDIHHTWHIIWHTSYIAHHMTYIIHGTSYDIHRTSHIIWRTSYIVNHVMYDIEFHRMWLNDVSLHEVEFLVRERDQSRKWNLIFLLEGGKFSRLRVVVAVSAITAGCESEESSMVTEPMPACCSRAFSISSGDMEIAGGLTGDMAGSGPIVGFFSLDRTINSPGLGGAPILNPVMTFFELITGGPPSDGVLSDCSCCPKNPKRNAVKY